MQKVPVFQTVADAYGFLFHDIGLFIQQAWYWTLLVFAAQVALVHSDLSVWLFDYIMSGEPNLLDNNTLVMLVGLQLRDSVSILVLPVTIAAYGLFSVRWQRALLLYEEMPSGVPTLPGKMELKGIGAMAVFILAFFLWKNLLLGVLVWPTKMTGSLFVTVLALAAWFSASIYVMRLLLAVPAAATKDSSASLYDSFTLGQNNGWRLLAIVFICVAPLYLVKLHGLTPDMYFMPGRASFSRGFNYPSWYAGVVIDFALLAIMQGGIAIAYRTLVSDERREQMRAAALTKTSDGTATGTKGRTVAIAILLAAGLAAVWSMLT